MPGSRPDDLLYEDFRKTKTPRKFFTLGKVFQTLWSEAADSANDVRSRAFTINSFGEPVHSKVRRFVVVKEGQLSCIAVPVTSYGGKGVAKRGVKKSDHTIIHCGKKAPLPAADELPNPALREAGMQPDPIRVDPDLSDKKLDEKSRVDFAKPSVIHHNVKVKSFGMVNRASLRHLHAQYRNVALEETPKPAPTFGSRSPSGAFAATTHSQSESMDTYRRAYHSLITNYWAASEALAVLAPYKALIDEAAEQRRSSVSAPATGSMLNGVDEEDEADDADAGDGAAYRVQYRGQYE
ncbi:uncharacterized protein LTR77_005237 [Saxophila tyrrhenica]|uniref:DUF6590 domain-containing protein n=1 Tax=Saxophila tyrrhenica TaxID=1690608 RepID=A0AAV9PFN5_9PEZI|nr:hypothetical protein LTR77_005237 [Saxophila tyrrhenica]